MSVLETLKQQGRRLNIALEPDGVDVGAPTAAIAVEEVSPGEWKAVEARIDATGVTVLSARRWSASDAGGDDAAAAVKHGGERLALFIPDPRQSVCRLLDMPDVPQAQLDQMVALRLEVELPYPPQESTWACRRLPSADGARAPVLLIAQATKSIDATEAGLRSRGVFGAGAAFAAAALLDLAYAPDDGSATIAVTRVDRDRALLAIGRGGALCYARHVRLPQERAGGNGASEQWLHGLARELKQCLFDYTMRSGGPAPTVLRLAGEGILLESDCTALETGLEMPVALVAAPDDLFVDDSAAIDGDLAADYALAAGALLGLYRERAGLATAAPALRPARPGGGLRLKRSMARLLAVNGLLIAALLASFFLVRNARLASGDRFVRESKALVQDMEVLKEEVDILRYEEGQRVSVLEILMALSEVLPQELKVESMNLDAKGTLLITGTTKSVEAVSDGVTGALKKSHLFKNPEFKGATQGQEGYGFTLTCELASASGAGR